MTLTELIWSEFDPEYKSGCVFKLPAIRKLIMYNTQGNKQTLNIELPGSLRYMEIFNLRFAPGMRLPGSIKSMKVSPRCFKLNQNMMSGLELNRLTFYNLWTPAPDAFEEEIFQQFKKLKLCLTNDGPHFRNDIFIDDPESSQATQKLIRAYLSDDPETMETIAKLNWFI